MSYFQHLITPRVFVSIMICIGLCSCAPPQQSAQPAAPQLQVSVPATQQVSEPSIAVPAKPSDVVPAKPPEVEAQPSKLVKATKPWAPRQDELSSYTEPTTGMEFIAIKGGTFVMGDILRKEGDSSPPHRVTVKDFWIGKYEVTFAQYDTFCEATNRKKPDDQGWGRGNRPVINVSWEDAVAFTEWLSKKAGRTFRLPSEAQWEYAARAGKSSAYWWGQQAEQNLSVCLDCGNQTDKRMTAPVGSLSSNAWGLFDILGNVSEWTFDKAHEGYNNAPTNDDPWLENGLEYRVVRGGSYRSVIANLKVYFRDWYEQDSASTETGFRVVILD